MEISDSLKRLLVLLKTGGPYSVHSLPELLDVNFKKAYAYGELQEVVVKAYLEAIRERRFELVPQTTEEALLELLNCHTPKSEHDYLILHPLRDFYAYVAWRVIETCFQRLREANTDWCWQELGLLDPSAFDPEKTDFLGLPDRLEHIVKYD